MGINQENMSFQKYEEQYGIWDYNQHVMGINHFWSQWDRTGIELDTLEDTNPAKFRYWIEPEKIDGIYNII